MNDDLRIGIFKIFFEDKCDDIKKGEKLEEFYNSFDKKELHDILARYVLIRDDLFLLDEVPMGDEFDKKEIVNYLLNNYMDIYRAVFSIYSDEFIFQWKMLLKKKGYCKVNILDGLDYSISFIDKLDKFKLAKINYDSNTDILEFLVPSELLNMVKKLLNDKELMTKRERISQIISSVSMVLNVYGVLSLEKLCEVINNVFEEVDMEELFSILRMVTVIDDRVIFVEDDDINLVAISDFENADDIYEFYNSLEEGDYKLFAKEQYLEIKKGIYHHKFKVYEELVDYLLENTSLMEEELDLFDEFIILDYLESSKSDIEVANKNLMSKFKESFSQFTLQDRIIIKKKLSDLAKLYPNFYLKGSAINEDKLEESYCYE